MQDAKDLAMRWVTMVQKNGIFEQYHPETGATFGPPGLSMSLLIVDILYKFKLI
jgi:hypothetical protein